MTRSVICHLFYPEVSQDLVESLAQLDDGRTSFFVNIQGNTDEHAKLYHQVERRLKGVRILKTSNKGRDIGAKLLLINLLLELNINSDYTLIIHDKKSPHLGDGSFWRGQLLKIIDPRYVKKVMEAFGKNAEIGVIGAANYIQNEYLDNADEFACNSSAQIKDVLKKYEVSTDDYDFVAGNIFWIRTNLLKSFFATRDIALIRADLEVGNALDFNKGTYIHAWERAMSWIATSQGYKVYGV